MHPVVGMCDFNLTAIDQIAVGVSQCEHAGVLHATSPRAVIYLGDKKVKGCALIKTKDQCQVMSQCHLCSKLEHKT